MGGLGRPDNSKNVEREKEGEATMEKARELSARRGRSRISYAQEVGVIKINMGCIRPGHVHLTSNKP